MADRSSYMKNGAFSWSLFVVLISLMIAIVNSSDHKVCSAHSKPHPQGICGSKIDEVVKLVCGKGNYNEKQYRKRRSVIEPNILDLEASSLLALSDHNAQPVETDEAESGLNFLLKRSHAQDFLDKRGSFYWDGVACDCCYHSCSIRQLSKYCKDTAKAEENIKLFFGLI